MEVSRDRSRRRHRVREPELKGKLGALCQGADQYEDERWGVKLVRTDCGARGEHLVEVVTPDDVPQNQYSGEEAKSASRCDDQGHSRTIPCLGALVPIADQQEGKEAGQLPEKHQLDQVARQHNTEHRAHECEQKGEEAGYGIGRRQVVSGVQNHEESDTGNQRSKHPREAVHPQVEFEAEFRDPASLVLDNPAIDDARVSNDQQNQSNDRDESGQDCFSSPHICAKQHG